MTKWLPIVDAPVDRAILVWASGYKIVHWNTAQKGWVGYGGDAETHQLNTWNKPMYWMPLPPAPDSDDRTDASTDATGA